MKNKTIAILMAIAVSASAVTAQAGGLLGEKYAAISYERGDLEGLDFWGASIGVNVPLTVQNENVGYDFFAAASHAEFDEREIDVDSQQLDLGITVFSKGEQFRPFASAAVGHSEASGDGISDNSFIYSLTAGVEILAGSNVSITPYIQYFDAYDLRDGDNEAVGLDVSFWIGEKSNIGFSYEHISDISDYGIDLDTYAIAYRFRF